MSRSVGYSVESNFSNGLVTEATGLSFPENAVTSVDNCVFDQKGTVSRRKGLDLEPSSVNYPAGNSQDIYVEYLWENVAGDGNLTFHVQQVGTSLMFFRATGEPTLSTNYIGSVSLPYRTTTDLNLLTTSPCQFSSGLGRLVVTHPYCEPFYVQYDKNLDTLTSAIIIIQTRDFKGLQPWPIGRSSSITQSHLYNLFNQGWQISRTNDYASKAGFYPGDYEVWWLYKTPDALGTEVFLTDVAISGGILNNLDRGNSPAPRGSTILAEFYQDRGSFVGGGIAVVTSGIYRPSSTEFFAGRIFYAGVNALDFGQKIYFSQILESTAEFGRCYQQNDPTSQYSPDLLPSDGGVIAIPDAGTIYKMVAVDNNLLVFASQGVWQITGSQGIGFTATDYTVKKISSATTLSPFSFVKVDGNPVWWSLDDVYTVLPESVGSLSVKSLSNERIKSYFQEIPEESKVYAKGAYNNRDRVLQWLFRDETASNPSERQVYTKILNINVSTQAFYPWSINSLLVFTKGLNVIKGQGSAQEPEDVTDNIGLVVTDTLGNSVFIENTITFTLSSAFKYTVVHGDNLLTFAEADDESSLDWSSVVGGPIAHTAYFTSGYRIRGQGIKKFQTNYLRVFVDNEEPQEFSFSSMWDYANSGTTGRWSSKQRMEFDDGLYDYQSRRIKLRGNGLALQFRVESIGESTFNIIGWSSLDTANERP